MKVAILSLRDAPSLREAPSLGVVKLDYSSPSSEGELTCAASFEYEVHYRVVPGWTFKMCQTGKMNEEIKKRFKRAIQWLVDKGVSVITGSCGYMMYYQHIAREITQIPVFMSSLCLLPTITCAFAPKEQIIIMCANGSSLEPMRDLIRTECGVDTNEKRYNIVGCQDVDGFEAVMKGYKVNYDKTEPGIIKRSLEALEKYPESRAFLLECTQLPPFADAIRYHTGLPVFDIITASNFFIESFQDNKLFGINDWQKDWDGEYEEYKFGSNLTQTERFLVVNKDKLELEFKSTEEATSCSFSIK